MLRHPAEFLETFSATTSRPSVTFGLIQAYTMGPQGNNRKISAVSDDDRDSTFLFQHILSFSPVTQQLGADETC